MGFIYLIHVREFLHKNECVYKIGRTDHLLQRMTQYPKGSKLLFCMNVNDNRLAERDLLNILARQYKIRVDFGSEYIEGVLDNILQTMFTYILRHNADSSDTPTTTVDAIGSRKVDPSILIMDFINGRKEELAGKIVKSRELYDQLQKWLCDNDHHVFISHVKMSRELTRLYGVGHKVHRFDTGVEQAICFSSLTCEQEIETQEETTQKKDDRNVLLFKFLKNVWKLHHEKESEIIGSTKLFEQFLQFCSTDIGLSNEQTKKWNVTLFARCIGNLAKDPLCGIGKYNNYGPKRLCAFEFHMQKLFDYINIQLPCENKK